MLHEIGNASWLNIYILEWQNSLFLIGERRHQWIINQSCLHRFFILKSEWCFAKWNHTATEWWKTNYSDHVISFFHVQSHDLNYYKLYEHRGRLLCHRSGKSLVTTVILNLYKQQYYTSSGDTLLKSRYEIENEMRLPSYTIFTTNKLRFKK